VVEAYALHHKKRKHPDAYEALRREHLDEENQLRVAGRWLDLYAVYASEAGMKADTLDTHNRTKNVPYSAEFVASELRHLLFLRPCGIGCTVVERVPLERAGSAETPGYVPAYAARTPLYLRSTNSQGGKERTRSLIPDLSVMRGFQGAFVLEGRGEGFDGALGWVPSGIGPPEAPRRAPREGHLDSEEMKRRYLYATARHELVSLWETEEDVRLGGEWVATSLRRMLGPISPQRHHAPYLVDHAEVCAAL
jgi:hypothetical protein